MMQKLFSWLAVVIFVAGCSSNTPKENLINTNQSAHEAYQEARSVLDSGLYSRAIELLKAIEGKYPFGPVARQIQLDLIYAYSQSGDSQKALAAIDRFIRLNPNNPDLDYVYYMRGLTNKAVDENGFQEFFGVDRADRDMASTRQAFDDFKLLVTTYPNSRYASAARAELATIKNKLARHELIIADYYSRRGAHLAAANRAKYLVENYRDVPQVPDALQIMVQSYDALGLTKLRDDAKAVLIKNYPTVAAN